jgi:hypothetical protein
MQNKQVGPAASVQVLADLVNRITYKPGWTFTLDEIDRGQGCQGLTLMIGAVLNDSSNPGQTVPVLHLMPVLPANYGEAAWLGWILEQIMLVEQHETLEFYKLDGEAPFFPGHAPGRNPYGVARVIHGLDVDHDTAYAPAKPWYGGPASDPHFDA